MVASTGSRVADAGLEKKVASPVLGIFAAMFSWPDALFRIVRKFGRSSSVSLSLSVQYETQEGLGLDGSDFKMAGAAEEREQALLAQILPLIVEEGSVDLGGEAASSDQPSSACLQPNWHVRQNEIEK